MYQGFLFCDGLLFMGNFIQISKYPMTKTDKTDIYLVFVSVGRIYFSQISVQFVVWRFI
jgi:hypothetical protein